MKPYNQKDKDDLKDAVKDFVKDFVCIETPIVSPYQILKSVKMQNENRKKEKK